jgi:HSP20 family protein
MKRRATKSASQASSPFEQHIRERMEQARQRIIGAPGTPSFSVPFMEPAVDIFETEDHVVIEVEIAGIRDEDLELEIEGSKCTLRGERKPARQGEKRAFRQVEISHGPFQRELFLPAAVNPDAVETVYKDGMLQIMLPKASLARSRTLTILVR